MRKNIWENIAKSFDIPLDREFIIDELAHQSAVYKFTQNGFICSDCNRDVSGILMQILSGKLTVTPKPWKPKAGDKYYHVEESISGDLYIETIEWKNDMADFCAYHCGNYFKSKEEAKAQMYELRSTLCKYYTEKDKE